MSNERVKLAPSWKARIGDYLERPDMQALSAFETDKALGACSREI